MYARAMSSCTTVPAQATSIPSARARVAPIRWATTVAAAGRMRSGTLELEMTRSRSPGAMPASRRAASPALRQERAHERAGDLARAGHELGGHSQRGRPGGKVDRGRVVRGGLAEDLTHAVVDHVVTGVVEDDEENAQALSNGDERFHSGHL